MPSKLHSAVDVLTRASTREQSVRLVPAQDMLRHVLYVAQLAANSLVGYAFARLLAYQFGTSAQKDGFDIAYSVPFIVLNLSGFAYIHNVITCQFSRLLARESRHISEVFCVALTWMTVVGVLLLGLAAMCSGWIAEVLAPGLPAEARAETRHLLILMLPLALTLGIGTYLGAVLAAYEVPLTGEFCQLASRLGVIVFASFAGFRYDLPTVAVGLVVASCAGLVVQWIVAYWTTGLRFRFRFGSSRPECRTLLKQGSGFLVCAVVAQLAMAYMRRAATLDGIGTNAALTYALAIVTPLALIIGKPLALTIGPRFARMSEYHQWDNARKLLLTSGFTCLLVTIPLCVVFSVFSEATIRLLFAGGRFDEQSIDITACLCACLTWTLPASVLRWIIVMPTLSTRDSSFPGIVFAIGHLVHIALTAVLHEPFGKYGIALAYVVAAYAQFFLGIGFLVIEWRNVRHNACQSLPTTQSDCTVLKPSTGSFPLAGVA